MLLLVLYYLLRHFDEWWVIAVEGRQETSRSRIFFFLVPSGYHMAVLVGDLSSPNVFLNGSNLFSLSPYPTTLSKIQIVQVFETRLDG